MERDGAIAELLSRVLDCRQKAVVLRGPAGCGKTSVALAMYARHLDDADRPHCLLVAPNAPAVAALRRHILACSPEGTAISPQVCTFAALGARLLAEAQHTGKLLSPLRRQMLLGRIVRELLEEKKLTSLQSVADTPGLCRALDRTIAELKRAAVEPEALGKIVPRGSDRRRDLLEIYRRYQKRLQEQDAYDVEGRMWQARDLLRDEDGPQLAGIEAIAVDGFTDFTPTQLEMLALLARGLRVLITLPYAEDGRERMWHWTRRTLNNIRGALGANLAEIEVTWCHPQAVVRFGGVASTPKQTTLGGGTIPETITSEPSPSDLRALWGPLFCFEPEACKAPEGLSLVAAAGLDAEVAAAARNVKRLLLDGAPAGSLAVLARSLEPYREAIRRIFADHQVPVCLPPPALTENPLVRFALDAASASPRFGFRDVLRVLRSSYFIPSAVGEFDDTAVAAAEMIVREGNVFEGRSTYAFAAQRLAARQPEDEEDGEGTIRMGRLRLSAKQIAAGGQLLEELLRVCELPLGQIVERLQLSTAARRGGSPERIARDLRALEAMKAALEEADEAGASPAEIRELLSVVAPPPARTEHVVDILDVLDARSLRYRHVLLLGATENQFPQPTREQALLTDGDRRELNLDNKQDLTSREMLLFYLAVTRADEGLAVSYLESDSSGRPHAPSSFLESLVAPCGGLKALGERTQRLAQGQFLPAPQDIAVPRDAMLAGLGELFGLAGVMPAYSAPRKGPGAHLAWSVRHAPEVLARACRGLWARHRRWAPGGCNEFDGRIGEKALLKSLAQRFPGGTVFSASQLNTYGQCPWMFFASYLLKLAELDEPERRLEAESRGVFCHNVLFRVLTDLRGATEDSCLAQVEEADVLAALDRAVQAEADGVEARRPAYPALWQIQKQQLHEQLKQYLLEQRSGRTLSGQCLHFELGFAMKDRAEDLLDPASSEQPLELKTPAGAVRVRGKIDRVDRVNVDGQAGLLVIDYKTGRLPSKSDIAEGRNLQLPLYALAARAVLAREPLGGAFHRLAAASGARESLFGLRRSRRELSCDNLDEKLQAAVETIGRLVAGMRDGRFDVLPTSKCPSYCPFGRICEHSPARHRLKAPSETQEAAP